MPFSVKGHQNKRKYFSGRNKDQAITFLSDHHFVPAGIVEVKTYASWQTFAG